MSLNVNKKKFIMDLMERKRLIKSYHKGEITKDALYQKGIKLVDPMNLKPTVKC